MPTLHHQMFHIKFSLVLRCFRKCAKMRTLESERVKSSLCGFCHCHPYIPIHKFFGKCFSYFIHSATALCDTPNAFSSRALPHSGSTMLTCYNITNIRTYVRLAVLALYHVTLPPSSLSQGIAFLLISHTIYN